MSEAYALPPYEGLFSENAMLLESTIVLLESLTPTTYIAVDARCLGGSIGAHTRHCIEFYQVFLDGLKSGRIDYDARTRDAEIENELPHAIVIMRRIAEHLRQMASMRDMTLQVDVIENRTESGCDWSVSSLGRELRFLLSHTVHHCALIAILLRLQGHAVSEGFGVAPSTLRHRAAQSTCASCAV